MASNLANGAAAVAFARPHEFRIVTDAGAAYGLAAKVCRILPSGATVRVELIGPKVLNGSGELPHFEVEVTREELAGMSLAAGQDVRLMIPDVRLFPYSPDR